MALNNEDTAHLKTSLRQLRKTKYVYDGSSRLIEIYEAKTNAAANSKCLKTIYTYVGATTVIDKSKEEEGTWLAAYDI